MNAQTDWCGTVMEENSNFNTLWSQIDQSTIPTSFENEEHYILKVHFWDINLSDDSNPELTETQMLNAVAELNRNYNPFNIFFKYDGVTELVNDSFYVIDTTEPLEEHIAFRDWQRDNNQYHQGDVNIYVVGSILPQNWIAYRLIGNENFITIVCELDYVDDDLYNTLTHEVGHFFNLKHTFHLDPPDPLGNVFKENVTRDVMDTCFNANNLGDRIVDTNATPQGMNVNFPICEYVPNGETDDCDVPYNAYGLQPEVNNFMSYGRCTEEFSSGQIAYMRWYIHQLVYNEPNIHAIEIHPDEILYEPYKGEYYLSGPMTEDHIPLFQYGFSYKFVDTSQADVWNQPSPYEVTNFWTGQGIGSYGTSYNQPIVHPNHSAFYIEQLGDFTYRKCYNNYNRTPSDGTVIKFMDGYPNGNYTITPQDSTSINNPALINNLEPGLYNIQKNFPDGTSQQTMILKESN